MVRKKFLTTFLIIIFFFIVATAVSLMKVFEAKNNTLLETGFNKLSTSTPTPMPLASPNAPKTFQFDSSTDLKAELEKVNPQILDSDFEEL